MNGPTNTARAIVCAVVLVGGPAVQSRLASVGMAPPVEQAPMRRSRATRARRARGRRRTEYPSLRPDADRPAVSLGPCRAYRIAYSVEVSPW